MLTVAEAHKRVTDELNRYTKPGRNWRVPPGSIIISTNVPLQKNGWAPLSKAKEPADSGVAVYFQLDGQPYCLPCDRWDRVADNLAAIAAHIEADRGQERWGVGSTSDRYAGFLALPAPKEEQWYEILGVAPDAEAATIRGAYKRKVQTAHPDRGGSDAAFDRITKARDAGLAATGRSYATGSER